MRSNNFMALQETQNIKVLEEIGTINRGVYGDKPNGTLGLLTRQDTVERDVRRLKNNQARAAAWGAGFVVGLNAIIFFFKELFTKN